MVWPSPLSTDPVRPPAGLRATAVPFVMVGGIPGAGKSRALATAAPALPGVRFLDSDTERERLTRLLPDVPYPVVRPLTHLTHQLRILLTLVRGPVRARATGGLVVHDPSTRWVRLALIGWLARARGWRPQVVFIDASREEALSGQSRRGRIVNRKRFEGHWERWQVLRGVLTGTADRSAPRFRPGVRSAPRFEVALAPWMVAQLVPRRDAADAVVRLAALDLDSPIVKPLSRPGRSPAGSSPAIVGETLSNGR